MAASFQVNPPTAPTKGDLETAELYGRRVAEVTLQFVRGRNAQYNVTLSIAHLDRDRLSAGLDRAGVVKPAMATLYRIGVMTGGVQQSSSSRDHQA